MVGWRRQPEVLVCGGCGDPTTRCAGDQPPAPEEGLRNFLDRRYLFTDGYRQRGNANRPTGEGLDECLQDRAVEPVEPGRIDVEQGQRGVRKIT